MSTEEKIKQLEEELHNTIYNKATQKHIGLLKARIARLKERAEKQSSKGGTGKGFSVKKTGDATIMIIGFPSVGKSTLLNQITNADSEVDEYEFTTVDVIPGMMHYRGSNLQVLDVPGIIQGASKGKGMGRQILSVVMNADLLLILLDEIEQLKCIEQELHEVGVRMNQRPPRIKIAKKSHGGLNLTFSYGVDEDTFKYFKKIITEFGLYNAEVIIRERVTDDQLIDVLSGNRKYVPAVIALNKCESTKKKPKQVDILISAKHEKGLDKLREMLFERLTLARIYLKKIGEKPDLDEPLVLKGERTVRHLCKSLHKEFLRGFNYARVWGKSAKFDGQRVGLAHKLEDGDIVELHVKR
ncbi:GTP-binding protein [archaeon]|nr:GTP-binding protein [archaeon]